MVVNPNGNQAMLDGGVPRTITGTAGAALSGGMLVYASGAAGNFGLTSSTFNSATDIAFQAASGLQFTGVVLANAESGDLVTVQTKGTVLLPAYGAVTAGQTVVCEGTHAVANGTTAGHVIGRALGTATSGNGVAVQLL